MSYGLLYLFLAAICLWGIRFSPTGMDVRKIMNRMNGLRLPVAVVLIFGHCTLPYAKIPLIVLPFHKASTFCVGYFFVLSGYGLAYSVASKPGYLDQFWKKVLNLVWITVFASVVSTLLQDLALGTQEPLRLINWYMPAIIVMYILFYAAYRLFPESKSARVIFLMAAVFLAIAAVCCYGKAVDRNYRNYFISEMAFPFGALIYEYADALSAFLKKKGSFLLLMLAEVVVGAAALRIPEMSLLDMVLHNLMLFPFILILFYLLDKLCIENALLKRARKYTTFLYLFQFPVLTILKSYYLEAGRPFDIFYFWGCLGLTCILAVVLQLLYDAAASVLHRARSSKQ